MTEVASGVLGIQQTAKRSVDVSRVAERLAKEHNEALIAAREAMFKGCAEDIFARARDLVEEGVRGGDIVEHVSRMVYSASQAICVRADGLDFFKDNSSTVRQLYEALDTTVQFDQYCDSGVTERVAGKWSVVKLFGDGNYHGAFLQFTPDDEGE